MSSTYLENVPAFSNLGADRFLLLLKTQGPQTSAQLGAALGITDEAVRQQLIKLANEGYVEARSEAVGVGRPAQIWRLAEAGNAPFPRRHPGLAVQVIDSNPKELCEPAPGPPVRAPD